MKKPLKKPPAIQPARSRLRFGAGALLLLALSGGLWWAMAPRAPAPPIVPTSGLDPATARLIERAIAEVRASPRSGAGWGKLGTVLLHHEFKSEAQMAFTQAARFSPKEPRWPYLHGVLLLNGQAQAAMLQFQAAVNLCPDQPDMPRLRLAQLLLERGRLEQAEQQFQSLLQSRPAHPLALLGMARIRVAQGRAAESANFLALCAGNPYAARGAAALLARVQQQFGNAAAADAAARQSASLPADRVWPDPFWSEALQYRVGKNARLDEAEALLKEGCLPDALKILSAVTNDNPGDAEALYQIGWILNQGQHGAEAERVLREHLRRSPESPKGHAQLAAALLAQERYADAVEVLRRALQLEPAWSELHFNLGYACARLGRPGEAIGHFRDALRHDPNYLDSYILLADLLSRRGETEEAVKLLRQALVLNPADERAKTLLQRLGRTAP